MPADGSQAAKIARPLRLYRCKECAEIWPLAELNRDMRCENCGEVEGAYDFDPTADELYRTERSWSV